MYAHCIVLIHYTALVLHSSSPILTDAFSPPTLNNTLINFFHLKTLAHGLPPAPFQRLCQNSKSGEGSSSAYSALITTQCFARMASSSTLRILMQRPTCTCGHMSRLIERILCLKSEDFYETMYMDTAHQLGLIASKHDCAMCYGT